MRYLQPQRWADVRPGTVVLLEGHSVPRAVMANHDYERDGWRLIFMEGMGPFTVRPADPVQPVEFDTADAIGNLFAAGLTIGVIE